MYEERQYDHVHEELGPYTGERLRLSNQESVAWDEVHETIRERSLTRMPRELLFSLGVVTAIAIAFVLGPLLRLDDPSLSERLVWLLSLCVLLIAVAGSIALAVRRSYRDLHTYQLYPHTQARLEDYELWIEGMQERDEQEKRDTDED